MWDYRRGSCEETLLGHRDVIHSCAVSRDGQIIISGGEDGEIKVFTPGRERREMGGMEGYTGEEEKEKFTNPERKEEDEEMS